MSELSKLRIDKYLWAIRAFKTRSIATEACKAGRVKQEGKVLKPSHVVKRDEVYTVQKGPDRRIIRVVALLERRVDARTAVEFYDDITPAEDKTTFTSMFRVPVLVRDRGTGRPTKRDRRDIDGLLDAQPEKEGWFEEDDE